jgi:hypothetical protein
MMRSARSIRAHVRAALVALAVAFSAGAARAADDDDNAETHQRSDAQKKQAQALFDQAVKLAKSDDARGALAAFRGAYSAYPSFRVLYNIGQLCSRLRDAACAVRAFEQYLRDGGADIPARKRADVEEELRSLAKQVASVTIDVDVAGAEISIDDERIGHSPLPRPWVVNPGSHKIAVTYETKLVERTVTASAMDTLTVDIQIPKDPAPEPVVVPIPPERAEQPRPPERRQVPVVPWVVTGGLAAGTVVTGILAAVTYSSFQDKRDEFPVTRAQLEDAQGTARTFFLAAGVLGACTIVSAGIAGYMTLSAPSAAPAGPTVGLAAGPRGVLVHGRFR